MDILVIQHVPFENPGYFADIFKKHKHTINYLNLYDSVPDHVPDFDFLLIMGGPMNIYEEDNYPWLKQEKIIIKHAIHDGKIVLGVCLGAQLIADSLGARIYKAAGREIGWFPVQKTNDRVLNFLPDFATVFHWHGETFDLPGGSTGLYRSDLVENQAFIFENRVLGLQFHLEMKLDGIKALYENCSDEVDGSDYVMEEKEMLDKFGIYNTSNKKMLKNIVKWLLEENPLKY